MSDGGRKESFEPCTCVMADESPCARCGGHPSWACFECHRDTDDHAPGCTVGKHNATHPEPSLHVYPEGEACPMHGEAAMARRAPNGTRFCTRCESGKPAHHCKNCEGIDPDSCLFNPNRPRQSGKQTIRMGSVDEMLAQSKGAGALTSESGVQGNPQRRAADELVRHSEALGLYDDDTENLVSPADDPALKADADTLCDTCGEYLRDCEGHEEGPPADTPDDPDCSCAECRAKRRKSPLPVMASDTVVGSEAAQIVNEAMEALEAERDALRAALTRIADMPTEPRPDGTYNYSRNALIDIARRALG